jgi:hypothetical protein
MPKIAISYRRSDTAAMSGRIFDRLAAHYGKPSVFMDVDNIPIGADFRAHIGETLRRTDVVLAVIGAGWLGGRTAAKRESTRSATRSGSKSRPRWRAARPSFRCWSTAPGCPTPGRRRRASGRSPS